MELRKKRACLALATASLFACQDRPKPPSGEASPASPASSAVATLGLDAGLFETVDPPPPAGDLKTEIERFVNLDTCVTERAKLDPLVGDALRAIGYDTLLRDACRLLEAAKDRKRETCDRIDASALRSRCQSWIAMIAQTPEACPFAFESAPARGRNATCLAVAGRDGRLCAGEGRLAPRATCEALATRDEKRCDALLPSDRVSCTRELVRWRSLLGTPLEGLPKLPETHAKLVVRGEGGTPGPATPEVDLASDFARGAVVVTANRRARVELGVLGESESVRFAPVPNKRPRVGVAVLFEPGPASSDPPKPTLERLELEIPGESTVVFPGARCACKITSARADRTRGGELAVRLEGTVGVGAQTYRVELDLKTFVRDVVNEEPGSRLLPPAHPTLRPSLPGTPTDAGR